MASAIEDAATNVTIIKAITAKHLRQGQAGQVQSKGQIKPSYSTVECSESGKIQG